MEYPIVDIIDFLHVVDISIIIFTNEKEKGEKYRRNWYENKSLFRVVPESEMNMRALFKLIHSHSVCRFDIR